MAIEVKVVFAGLMLLAWLIATLVSRHYDKLREASANVRGAQPAPPWWVRIGEASYPVADVATLRAWARDPGGRRRRDDRGQLRSRPGVGSPGPSLANGGRKDYAIGRF
jgi:hypothetical protein